MVVHYLAIYYHLLTNDSEVLLISCDEYSINTLQNDSNTRGCDEEQEFGK